MAKELSQKFEHDIAKKMKDEENMSEMEAIRIAIEERRKVEYQEKLRKETEEKDLEFAKFLLCDEEEKELQSKQASYEQDSKYAEQVTMIFLSNNLYYVIMYLCFLNCYLKPYVIYIHS